MAERLVRKHAVPILSAHFFPLNEPALLQIMDDALNSSLRDAHFDGNLPKHELRI
jgi:hypothetical protein